ncbi:MAG: hypothetical protein KA275_00930 [Chitinophagaceae bacterium]|nr:hypothetical protein [Chitinophagaceae bacterium]
MKKQHLISKYCLIFIYIFLLLSALLYFPRWNEKKTEATLSWDVSGYYMYLPAIFIYEDIKKCSFSNQIIKTYTPSPQFDHAFIHEKSGNYVMKYSCGMAILYSPYFFIAHTYCIITNSFPADGFSFPYQLSIGIGMLLYAFIGLYFLRKILLYYYSDKIVAIILSCIFFGTNYLNYSIVDQAYTHISLFAIYTLIIYLSIKFYQNPKIKTTVLIGLLCGLATLIRPSEIICILIPLLWEINTWIDFKNRCIFFIQQKKYYLIALFFFSSVVFIQLFYWYIISGEWIIYSYQDQGFNFLHPHTIDFCFSAKCGWLRLYPIMILPFLGLYVFAKKGENKIAVLSFFLLNFYIVTSWNIWDYGGTCGRAMIQSYPILAFPMASFLKKILKHQIGKILFSTFFLLCIYLNIWWTHNAHLGSVQVNEMTAAYYWRVLGRWKINDDDKKLLDNKYSYSGKIKNSKVLFSTDFEKDSAKNIILKNENNKVLQLRESEKTSKNYFIENNQNIKTWIRAFAHFSIGQKEWNTNNQTQFTIIFYNNNEIIQQNYIRVQRLMWDGENKEIYVDAKKPEKAFDKINIFINNMDSKLPIEIDNLKVITFDTN